MSTSSRANLRKFVRERRFKNIFYRSSTEGQGSEWTVFEKGFRSPTLFPILFHPAMECHSSQPVECLAFSFSIRLQRRDRSRQFQSRAFDKTQGRVNYRWS